MAVSIGVKCLCRLADALFHAMLLWYYSTLTLQEHILIANGSRYESGHFTHILHVLFLGHH